MVSYEWSAERSLNLVTKHIVQEAISLNWRGMEVRAQVYKGNIVLKSRDSKDEFFKKIGGDRE